MKYKFYLVIILVISFIPLSHAKPVIEAGLLGSYSLYGDFDPGMGFSLEGRWVTKGLKFTRSDYVPENLHKIGLSIQGLYAKREEFRDPPQAGWDNTPSYEEKLSAYVIEIAPMFCVNDGDIMKNYVGVGFDLFFVNVEESGVYYEEVEDFSYDEKAYSIDKGMGIPPGLRFFMNTQWFFNPQVAAELSMGFRLCNTRKLKNSGAENLEWRTWGEDRYNLNGLNIALGITYLFKKPGYRY